MVTRLVNILAEEKEAILYNNDWKKRKYKIHVLSDLISSMNEGLLADYDKKSYHLNGSEQWQLIVASNQAIKTKITFFKNSFVRNYKLLR